MLFKKEEKAADDFWKEFEEKTGEKVINHNLGKYVSGWEEFDNKKWDNLWGLIITTSGGFHFHHFAQTNMLDSFVRFSGKEQPKEKTFFIPKEKIISSELIKETKWWKKIFSNSSPKFILIYKDEDTEKRLVFEDILKSD